MTVTEVGLWFLKHRKVIGCTIKRCGLACEPLQQDSGFVSVHCSDSATYTLLALPFLGANPRKLASQRDLPGTTTGDHC